MRPRYISRFDHDTGASRLRNPAAVSGTLQSCAYYAVADCNVGTYDPRVVLRHKR